MISSEWDLHWLPQFKSFGDSLCKWTPFVAALQKWYALRGDLHWHADPRKAKEERQEKRRT
eukprot:4590460-Pyramimonas_sp.AAC.1